MHLVSDPDKQLAAWSITQDRKSFSNIGSNELHPTDDTGDLVVRSSQLEQLGGLVGNGDGLNENRPVDSCSDEERLQLHQAERAAQRREVRGPWLVAGLQVPDVMVRIDPHGR